MGPRISNLYKKFFSDLPFFNILLIFKFFEMHAVNPVQEPPL